MKPLATTQLMMTWLSMCPADESSTKRQKMAHIAYTLAVFIINVICLAASLVFCLEHISIDFDSAIFAFMVCIGEFGLIYFMIVSIQMRHQIAEIFTGLSTIYKSSKFTYRIFGKLKFFLKKKTNKHLDTDHVGVRYLVRANNDSEWMWTFYFKYVKVSLANLVVTSLLSVLYSYLTEGNLRA